MLLRDHWKTVLLDTDIASYLSQLSDGFLKEWGDLAHLYNSACSYAANPVRINPIFMSIIFHHYKQLTMIAKQI
jgi:hypothetical protein